MVRIIKFGLIIKILGLMLLWLRQGQEGLIGL